ncbi:MAG: hypothetical protein KDJ23_00155 [Rhodoblastus sp.]|nr:hypothetical protein [Rhodoblastus sp.]MCC0001522.1 hypothetical protein [Methylobacteriaceae bacterium]
MAMSASCDWRAATFAASSPKAAIFEPAFVHASAIWRSSLMPMPAVRAAVAVFAINVNLLDTPSVAFAKVA